MTAPQDAVGRGRADGAFAAIAVLAGVTDPEASAEAHREAMRSAYWDDKDLALTTAIAYAGAARLLGMAADAGDPAAAYDATSAAKGLMYDLASFTWPGWDEPGVVISPTDTKAGLAAARANLAWAVELGKPDLAHCRAHWMLGAHLLTARRYDEAEGEFERSAAAAIRAGAEAEALLARAFEALAALSGGTGAEEDLAAPLDMLGGVEHGADFQAQVTTARRVLGL